MEDCEGGHGFSLSVLQLWAQHPRAQETGGEIHS